MISSQRVNLTMILPSSAYQNSYFFITTRCAYTPLFYKKCSSYSYKYIKRNFQKIRKPDYILCLQPKIYNPGNNFHPFLTRIQKEAAYAASRDSTNLVWQG